MERIKLGNRLSCIASMLEGRDALIDIGSDHAYLPAFCLQNSICGTAVVTDINEGPLENAKKTIEAAGVEDRVRLVLSDGFDNVDPVPSAEIVIAGMGGILISEILSRAGWIRSEDIHLVLQPMTHAFDVRSFLSENGFAVDREAACVEGGKPYCVISAHYCGVSSPADDVFCYFGKLIGEERTPEAEACLKKVYTSLKKKRDGLEIASPLSEEKQRLDKLIGYYEENHG